MVRLIGLPNMTSAVYRGCKAKNQSINIFNSNNMLILYPCFIPPAYEVYRGYIVFAFSVTMFVC